MGWSSRPFRSDRLSGHLGALRVSLAAKRAAAKEDRMIDAVDAENQSLPATVEPTTPYHHAHQDWPDPASLPDLSDHQREQYAKAAHGYLGLLGGRPGTGKTFSLARLLHAIPAGRSAVAAPTGKAAVRITESLNRAGVQGMRAKTIHSMLRVKSADDGWQFEHDESNPLPLDWIFVDESSMIPCDLAANLLAARRTGCRVMLIGDVNQLAPVGHGAPLRDLTAAGLPYGELTEIQRNSGRIVRACHTIIDHQRFEPSPALDLAAESPENLLHVERRDPTQQIETVKAMLEKFRQGATLAVRDGNEVVQRRIDPVWDCQILVPLNDKGELCRVKLNKILQEFLNPMGQQTAGSKFRVGDKVVCGQNGWVPVESITPKGEPGGPWNQDADARGRVFVANGELGKVLAVMPRYTVVRLWAPDRVVRVPKGESFENESGQTENTGCSWDLAFALSVHRSQGSEWPVTMTMLDGYAGARMLCTREWLYTALSRARILSATIGERDVAEAMCRKSGLWNRKTFLVDEIKGLQAEGVARLWDEELLV